MSGKKNKETLCIILLGLVIFSVFNAMMIMSAPEAWTSLHYGAWTAFHKNFNFSGFDQSTYIVISQWRPIFVHMRHPALLYMMWPMMQINEWLRDAYGINCTIYIVGVVWTLVSTLSWTVMYKILRNLVEMTLAETLLLNVFFYSFAYVMLATFVPDHMILSMTILLLMLYFSGKALKQGKRLSSWKAAVLFFIATGISTTNCVKVYLIDAMVRLRSRTDVLPFIRHSLIYVLPAILIAGIYLYQEQTANVEEQRYQKRVSVMAMKRDSVKYAQKLDESKKKLEARENKQLINNPLFEWTDMSIPIVPTIFDNIFGEGLQLHSEYLLGDANVDGQRPVIVKYGEWYNYVVEYVVLLLFLLGIVAGCRERFFWMCMVPFLFDMVLHVGLRFALTDVYIMTAHWAFVIPIAIAYLLKRLHYNKAVYRCTYSVLVAVTLFMLVWNISLIAESLYRI